MACDAHHLWYHWKLVHTVIFVAEFDFRVVNRAPPGPFPYHDRLGGQIRPPPSISRTNGRIEPRETAFRKLSTRSFQGILKILRLTLSLGSRSGQRSNFDVYVWRSLGPAISIVFARKSAKVASKCWWRSTVSIRAKISTGQGQAQFMKCHKRSQESNILFRMMIIQIEHGDSFSHEHMIYSYFCM